MSAAPPPLVSRPHASIDDQIPTLNASITAAAASGNSRLILTVVTHEYLELLLNLLCGAVLQSCLSKRFRKLWHGIIVQGMFSEAIS